MSIGGGFGVALVACCVVSSAAVAWAGDPDRPTEDDLFGGAPARPDGGAPATTGNVDAAENAGSSSPTTEPTPKTTTEPTPKTTTKPATEPTTEPTTANGEAGGRDTDLLGDPNAGPRLSQDVAPEDPLRIGGQLYLRAAYSNPGWPVDFLDQASPLRTFSAPSLVDAYFDARPNDRVRGFVLGRMSFDPTRSSTEMAPTTGMGTEADPTGSLLSGTSNTRGPSVLLDQLWLRFDVLHTVFVTAGRQHVKWGTARFWTPTDFLHPVHRNPTAVFDARPGFTMLKLHLPWERRGWNFYAFGLVEGVRQWDRTANTFVTGSDTTQNLSQIGGAARAELVFGPAELGLDIVGYRNQKPRYGADLSFGIGDVDLYVDAGFQYGSELPRVDAGCVIGTLPANCVYYSVGIKPQVAAGFTYSVKYNDNDVFSVGGEYFYNSRGYSSPRAYPWLLATGLFEPSYLGEHYAAVVAILNAPWSWNYTNFIFSSLGNLSDQSFLSRLDYSHTLLTHLTFEAFGAVNYGRREGEFRLGVSDLTYMGRTLSLRPQAFSLGLGLRIKI